MQRSSTSQRLKQIMLERNLRQVDILEKSKPYQRELGVKMGRSALSQYVTGKSKPDDKKLTLLSQTLDVSETWLMGYDAPKERDNNSSFHPTPDETPQYKMIQRKAKSLSVSDQERLLQLMDLTFQDVLSGGVDDEHDF